MDEEDAEVGQIVEKKPRRTVDDGIAEIEHNKSIGSHEEEGMEEHGGEDGEEQKPANVSK